MVINRTPWIFQDLAQELDRMSRTIDGACSHSSGCSTAVASDMKLEGDEAILSLELPGVNPSDLEVTLENRDVHINARRESSQSEEEEVARRERSFGTYSRRYALPWPVAEDGISAELKHGVLTVRLSRAPEAAPLKIEVQIA